LFFFERILRWASRNDDLTVPYWNYTDPGYRQLPNEFREETADRKANPLYLPATAGFKDETGAAQDFPMRSPSMNAGGMLNDAIATICPLTRMSFSNCAPDDEDACFGGRRAATPWTAAGAGGALERRHDFLHTVIGGSGKFINGQQFFGFMHLPETSARDPIFWVVHSNIDRLWVSWQTLDKGRVDPLDSEWLDQPFTFYDVDKGKPKAVTVRVCQLLDTRHQLGYKYDALTLDLSSCDEGAAPAIHEIARRLVSVPESFAPPVGHEGIPIKNLGSKTIPLPLLTGVKADAIRSVADAALKEGKGGLALSIEKLVLKEPPDVGFEMYLNLPPGAQPTERDPHYIGRLAFFGMGHAHAGQEGASQMYVRMGFSRALLRLMENEVDINKLVLTIVPNSGLKAAGQALQEARNERTPLSIGRIQILQMR
jgi:tyrosinase